MRNASAERSRFARGQRRNPSCKVASKSEETVVVKELPDRSEHQDKAISIVGKVPIVGSSSAYCGECCDWKQKQGCDRVIPSCGRLNALPIVQKSIKGQHARYNQYSRGSTQCELGSVRDHVVIVARF